MGAARSEAATVPRVRAPSVRVALALVLVLALAVRLAAIAATDDFKPVDDAQEYDQIARSIESDGRYPPTRFARPGTPNAFRPPAYPYLLGFTYEITGPSWKAGRMLGAALGTVSVALVALIAMRLWGPLAGIGAGLMAALYPPLVMLNGSLMSEALFVPLVLALVLLLVTWRQPVGRTALAVAAGAGMLCGLAALTRSVGWVLAVPVLIWAWQLRAPARRRLAVAALVLATTAATVAPWTVRNQRAFDTFVPMSTQEGFNLAGAYNADAGRSGPLQGTWRPPFLVDELRPLFGPLDEEELNRRLRSEAVDYAADHPTYPLVALGKNSLRLFGLGPGHRFVERRWYGEMGIPTSAQAWTRLSVYLVSLLALAAVVAGRGRRPGAPVFLWVIPALMFLSVVFIHGGPRYRVPLDPFLVLAAASAIPLLVARRRQTE